MGFRVDPNGKIFTDRVRKETVACVIQTVSHRLRGRIFKSPDNRVIDDMNAMTDSFMAVTDAEVLDGNDNVIARSEFMLVGKRHVVWVLPATDAATDSSDADA
ncbi:MAG TPA: hypothetical protein VF669_17595 [Tepidisphaeraceae bacterium]|jgi:hypothetical protein